MAEHPRTCEILQKFPEAVQIPIHHYKDVFCRKRQDIAGQEEHPMLIIPGMVASVDILTGKKTILSYLLKPIIRARAEALRER